MRSIRRLASRSREGPCAAGGDSSRTIGPLLDKRADITAIIVATPTHLHRAIVMDVISAQRHVFCESPLASTVEDCEAMAAAAASAKTVVPRGVSGPIQSHLPARTATGAI